MQNLKPIPTPIEPNMKISKEMEPSNNQERSEMQNRPYRELIGGLIYHANATRPDIAFTANTLSRFCSDPGKEHWNIAKRVHRYLKATLKYKIEYTKNDEKIKAFTDSDWAGDVDDRKSCTGNVIMLVDGPISWRSNKQRTVSLFTMEAEYAAMSELSREVVYMIRLLSHMGFTHYVEIPIIMYCDNQSAIELSKNAIFHKRSKHIDISYHYTRELVEKGIVKMTSLSTESMIADICLSMLNMK